MINAAREVCTAVKNALDAGRTVYITDVTETRKVISAEFLAATSDYRSYENQILSIMVDYGDGENKVWEIIVTWPWDELDGWALDEVDGSLFIAPEWWLKL